MAGVSPDLQWQLVSKNNKFLVKRNGNCSASVQFSSEPNNLYGLNTFKYSGLANKKTVSITPGSNLPVYLATSKTKKTSMPKESVNRSHLKRDVRRMATVVVNQSEDTEERFMAQGPPSNEALFAPPPEWEGWQKRQKEEQILASQGISIRRRPPTGPPQHHVGPFEFRIQSEGNTPRNKLEEIIWNKDVELSQMKDKTPLITILKALPSAPPARDFVGALLRRAAETDVPALIAEVKKASPSKGVIQPNFDPVRIAKAYEEGGAACISVLTDSKYFQGDFEYLKAVRAAGVQCPLLCKEFIIDAWQLYFARLHGADAVLLIAAVLPDQDLRYLSKICKKLGMAVLVEVHNTRELDRVLGIEDIHLIGINNRDLETFIVDINNTVELLKGERGDRIRERNILVVGESGLFTPSDIALLQNAGVHAVLVGESLVKQNNPAAGIEGLFGKDISLSRQAELEVAA